MLYQPFDANSQHMGLPWTSMGYVSTASSSVNDSWVVKAIYKGICPSCLIAVCLARSTAIIATSPAGQCARGKMPRVNRSFGML